MPRQNDRGSDEIGRLTDQDTVTKFSTSTYLN